MASISHTAPSPAFPDLGDMWRCGDAIDWQKLLPAASFLSGRAGHDGRPIFLPLWALCAAMAAILCAPVSASSFAGPALAHPLAIAIGLTLAGYLLAGFVFVLAKRTAETQIFQAGVLWRQTLDARGSINSALDIYAFLEIASEPYARRGTTIDELSQTTVEGLAFWHGANCANTFPPAAIDAPTLAESACLSLCLKLAALRNIPQAGIVGASPEMEHAWRSRFPEQSARAEAAQLELVCDAPESSRARRPKSI